jgi:hypothetical protein
VGVWDASGNDISAATFDRLVVATRICAAAPMAAARCRLALATGLLLRFGEHSVVAYCPTDCIQRCASCCSTKLVLHFLMAQSTGRSVAAGGTSSVTAVEEGVPPTHVSSA